MKMWYYLTCNILKGSFWLLHGKQMGEEDGYRQDYCNCNNSSEKQQCPVARRNKRGDEKQLDTGYILKDKPREIWRILLDVYGIKAYKEEKPSYK